MLFTPPPIWRATPSIRPKSFVFNGTNQSLSKVIASTTPNRTTFSLSLWIKANSLAANITLCDTLNVPTNSLEMVIGWVLSTGHFQWASVNSIITTRGQDTPNVGLTTGVWNHILVAVASSQATADNRVRMYFNGVEQSDTPVGNGDPGSGESQNFMVNGQTLGLGAFADGVGGNLNGKLAFVQIIEGTQVVATDVGELVGSVWSHKKFAGSFGT